MSTSYKEEHVPGFVKLFSGLEKHSVSEAMRVIHGENDLDHVGFFLWMMQAVDKVLMPSNFDVWIDPGQDAGDVRMIVRPVWWRMIQSPMIVIHLRECNGSINVYCSNGEQQDQRNTKPLFFDAFTDAVRLFHKSLKRHVELFGSVDTTVSVIRSLDIFIHTLSVHIKED
jgi:hypothetical protein